MHIFSQTYVWIRGLIFLLCHVAAHEPLICAHASLCLLRKIHTEEQAFVFCRKGKKQQTKSSKVKERGFKFANYSVFIADDF